MLWVTSTYLYSRPEGVGDDDVDVDDNDDDDDDTGMYKAPTMGFIASNNIHTKNTLCVSKCGLPVITNSLKLQNYQYYLKLFYC